MLLDTDHVDVLKNPDHPRFASLPTQLNTSADQNIATTIITVEEHMRGWLAWIHRSDDVRRQVPAYHELLRLFDFFARWHVLPFDEQSASEFQALRAKHIRIGTMDLKIAAIALSRDALLLSANLRDFQPGFPIFVKPIGSIELSTLFLGEYSSARTHLE
jgi:tRNA(fMet)-specific endonuclease VapC